MRLGEKEIIEGLRRDRGRYAPLVVVSVETPSREDGGSFADAVIELRVEDGPAFRALAEIAVPASPRVVRQKSVELQELVERNGKGDLVPLIVAPYMPARQAETLQRAGVSWLDMSGNMVIRVRDRVYIERTGRPNRFPDSAPIRKVFEGTASLVPRALLLCPPGFTSLAQLVEFITQRDGTIALSTVSKVLRSLEEDLLVSRAGQSISAIDPGQLLDRLAGGYASSRRRRSVTVSRFFLDDPAAVLKRLGSTAEALYVCCGFYAAQLKGLAVGDQISLYVNDTTSFRETVEQSAATLQPDEEFGNLRVIESRSRLPWFNSEMREGIHVVDDMQLYLEMMLDTPRGPKVAEALRQRILPEGQGG
jgi:hypothetical protein